MRKFTPKRAALEREYKKVQCQIFEERGNYCEGCGRNGLHISFSHRIPRSRRLDLMCDPENIDLMCLGCHDKVETGHFDELANGDEILAYIELQDPELYELKIAKIERREVLENNNQFTV